jgi:hypothetical protein
MENEGGIWDHKGCSVLPNRQESKPAEIPDVKERMAYITHVKEAASRKYQEAKLKIKKRRKKPYHPGYRSLSPWAPSRW